MTTEVGRIVSLVSIALAKPPGIAKLRSVLLAKEAVIRAHLHAVVLIAFTVLETIISTALSNLNAGLGIDVVMALALTVSMNAVHRSIGPFVRQLLLRPAKRHREAAENNGLTAR